MGIRINIGIKRIEVNDEGDYITLNFRDQELPDKLKALMKRYDEKMTEIRALEKKVYDNVETEQQGMALYDIMTDFSRYLVSEVDHLLGEGSCRKIFGVDVPALELFTDLFEQLTPYFQEGFEERARNMTAKYSPARTGNV